MKNPDHMLTIIIPAYNESANLNTSLPLLLEFCNQRNWELIIINDGSKDDSKAVLNRFSENKNLTVINHKLNKGYGAAIKTGIAACSTEYAITIDADGQHYLEDVEALMTEILAKDADMVVGSRKGLKNATMMRGLGKSMIRIIARMLMYVPIHDINSGMKIFRVDLAKNYLYLTPDTMAYSDTITLIFINNRHLVLEKPIKIKERISGESTIGFQTAFQTVMEIINIVTLFNPMKIFLPLAAACFLITMMWGLPLALQGRGVSIGSLLGIIISILFFVLGLIAEQLSQIRRSQHKNHNPG